VDDPGLVVTLAFRYRRSQSLIGRTTMPFITCAWTNNAIIGRPYAYRKKAEAAAIDLNREWRKQGIKSATVNIFQTSTGRDPKLIAQAWEDGVVEPWEGDQD
jgi:hypothetical protein